jgi:hypothetical protein
MLSCVILSAAQRVILSEAKNLRLPNRAPSVAKASSG